MTASISRRALFPLAAAAAATPIGGNPAVAQTSADIHLRFIGEGATNWVFVHPFSASSRFAQSFGETYAREFGVRVIAPDLPSHGRSRLVQQFSYDAAADSIFEALIPYQHTTALYIGVSSGGIVALKLAARARRSVAAIGVGASFSEQNIANMAATSRELAAATKRYIDAHLEQGDAQRDAIQRHFGDLAGSGRASFLSVQECAALERKALIMNGSADDFFLRDNAHALAESIPLSRLVFATGGGHFGPLEAPFRDFTMNALDAHVRSWRQPME